nr:MAG TPA: hypothetical protein [Caudoviricetes sp.]
MNSIPVRCQHITAICPVYCRGIGSDSCFCYGFR